MIITKELQNIKLLISEVKTPDFIDETTSLNDAFAIGLLTAISIVNDRIKEIEKLNIGILGEK